MMYGARAATFALLCFALDRGLGLALKAMYVRTMTGDGAGLLNYPLVHSTDVLVLGSSRARHHVVPEVIAKKLGLSVYNAGANGQDLLYSMLLMDLRSARTPPPKQLLINIDPISFIEDEEEIQRTFVLSPYDDESAKVRRALQMRGRYEPLKLASLCYRMNGKVLPVVTNSFSKPSVGFDGFVPLNGTFAPAASATSDGQLAGKFDKPFWPIKTSWFRQLLDYCRVQHVLVTLVRTPSFGYSPAEHSVWMARVRRLISNCLEVVLLDESQYTIPELRNAPAFFHDGSHLNSKGARLFSEHLSRSLSTR